MNEKCTLYLYIIRHIMISVLKLFIVYYDDYRMTIQIVESLLIVKSMYIVHIITYYYKNLTPLLYSEESRVACLYLI